VPFLLAERARSECARSMRAVKGNLATPSVSGNKRKNRQRSLGLVGGRVRKSRTVQDQ